MPAMMLRRYFPDASGAIDLVAHETAVPLARRLTAATLTHWKLEELTDTAELIVSELMTNAVRASKLVTYTGKKVVKFKLMWDDPYFKIEVWDPNPHKPVVSEAGELDESGRGMGIIDFLAESWGYYDAVFGATTFGKVVWARLVQAE